MKSYRFSFWGLVVVTVLNFLLMLNIHNNGLDALPTLPLHLLVLVSGITFFLIILIKGIRLLSKREEARNEIGWERSDGVMHILNPFLVVLNIVFIWALAR